MLISAISGNICPTNLTDLHGYAEYIHSLPILQFYTKALLNFGVRGYFDKKNFGVRVFFNKIHLRDSGFFYTFAADYQIVTIWKESKTTAIHRIPTNLTDLHGNTKYQCISVQSVGLSLDS